MIKVSCIMPVYNAGNYLQETMKSLLNQTLKEIEIICINDNSSDNSLELLLKLQEEDRRLHIINEQTNRGAAVCRNIGISYAKGDYLIFLDADDFFFSQMLEETYNSALRESADAVIFGYESIILDREGKGKEIETFKPDYGIYDTSEINIELLRTFYYVPWNKLVRRRMVENNQIQFQDIPNANDVFYSFLVGLNAKKLVALDKILIRHYSGRENSLTAGRNSRRNYSVLAFKEIYRYISQRQFPRVSSSDFMEYVINDLFWLIHSDSLSEIVRKDICQQITQDVFMTEAIMNELGRMLLPERKRQFVLRLMSGEEVWNYNIYKYFPDSILGVIHDAKRRGKTLALWGYGKLGKIFMQMLEDENADFDYIVDRDSAKWGLRVGEHIIQNYHNIEENVDIVLVLNPRFIAEISMEAKGKQIVDVSKL